MTIEEILAGESKNVEFKENLPEKSIKYMKSVVAFANGTGGKIIFGIADKTREVVGFDKEDVFKKMDAIANAVSDSCEPAIIPDITLQTVDGKTVIVVEVSEGRQRPYYIKALGRDGGVYVRVAGTTRLADEYMIKELLFEGSNRYYDQTLCTGLNVTDEDIDVLCKAMKEQAVRNARTEEQKATIKDVGRQQLRSWGVLIERDGKDYPSNDGIFWVHENDIDKYVDIYNPVQLRYDKRTKVNPIPKTMNFGLSKGLTFNRVLIYPTKPMLEWLSGKSKDMKDESLSKFYVAVTRARYSVAFVYKTKRLPSNDIGTKWTPDVL